MDKPKPFNRLRPKQPSWMQLMPLVVTTEAGRLILKTGSQYPSFNLLEITHTGYLLIMCHLNLPQGAPVLATRLKNEWKNIFKS